MLTFFLLGICRDAQLRVSTEAEMGEKNEQDFALFSIFH
jgi:hypothetical protein